MSKSETRENWEIPKLDRSHQGKTGRFLDYQTQIRQKYSSTSSNAKMCPFYINLLTPILFIYVYTLIHQLIMSLQEICKDSVTDEVANTLFVHQWLTFYSCKILISHQNPEVKWFLSHLWYPFQNPWRRTHFGLCYSTFPSSHHHRWTHRLVSPSFSSFSSSCVAGAAFWGRQTWGK